MLTKAHFTQGGLTEQQFEAHFGGGILKTLQDLLARVENLGPAGAALAAKTVADVQAGNWIAVVGDILALWQMVQAAPAPA